jgi:hypothetical protein
MIWSLYPGSETESNEKVKGELRRPGDAETNQPLIKVTHVTRDIALCLSPHPSPTPFRIGALKPPLYSPFAVPEPHSLPGEFSPLYLSPARLVNLPLNTGFPNSLLLHEVAVI